MRVNGTSLPTDGSARALNLVFDETCFSATGGRLRGMPVRSRRCRVCRYPPLSGLMHVGFGQPGVLSAAFRSPVPRMAQDGARCGQCQRGAHPRGGREVFTLSVSAVNEQGAVTRAISRRRPTGLRFYVQRTAPGRIDGVLNVPGAARYQRTIHPVVTHQPVGVQPAEFVGGVFNSSGDLFRRSG